MRLLSLMNREVRTSKRELLTYALTIVLILVVNATFQAFFSRYNQGILLSSAYDELFSSFLMLGGFILTSLMFSQDMFSKDGQQEWLMLPATSLEKFLSKALLSAFAYPLALIALFFATSLVGEPLLLLFFKNPIQLFNPFVSEVGTLLVSYWVWQSVFLLGATYFHKAHFIKTVLAIGVIGISLGLLGMLFSKIVFSIKFGSSYDMFNTFIYFDSSVMESPVGGFKVLNVLGKIVYYVLLPVFCWITAYFRVEEVQATDAI